MRIINRTSKVKLRDKQINFTLTYIQNMTFEVFFDLIFDNECNSFFHYLFLIFFHKTL